MEETDALRLYEEADKWAVLGANADPEKFGYKIYKRLKGKNKTVYGVNPGCDSIEGDKLYKSLSDLPEKVDIVVFVVNPSIGIGQLPAAAEMDLKAIWLQPGTISDELMEKADRLGLTYVRACVLVVSSYYGD